MQYHIIALVDFQLDKIINLNFSTAAGIPKGHILVGSWSHDCNHVSPKFFYEYVSLIQEINMKTEDCVTQFTLAFFIL